MASTPLRTPGRGRPDLAGGGRRFPEQHDVVNPLRAVTPRQVHLASLLAGFAVLAFLNRHLWFFQDDWDFLMQRGLSHAQFGLFTPHNEHWSTLPILEFRLVVNLFGLKTIWPTLIVLLAAHIVVAHALWRIAVRCAVDPWLATALVGIFLVLGAGADNITWDFQIGFTGAVALGLLAMQSDRLRLASRHRLWTGWALLIAALMCSSIGITMTVVAGLDCLGRRKSSRKALAIVSVPAVVYVVWYVLIGHTGFTNDHFSSATLYALPTFVWTGLSFALGGAFGLADAGPVLLVVLVVWTARNGWAARGTRASPAFAMAAGAIVLFAFIGLGRTQDGVSAADETRYAYIGLALLLPLIGVALSDLVSTAHHMISRRAVVFTVLALVLVANLGMLQKVTDTRAALIVGLRAKLLAAAVVVTDGDPVLTDQPDPSPEDVNVTTSGLAAAKRQGQLPTEHLDAAALLAAKMKVNVALTAQPLLHTPLPLTIGASGGSCLTDTPVRIVVPRGGGTIVVTSTQTEALGVQLSEAGLTGPLDNLPLLPGRSILNLSASGTTATVTPSLPGVTFCSD